MIDDKDPQTYRTARFLFDGVSVEKLVGKTGWTREQIEGVRAWAEEYVARHFAEEYGRKFDASNPADVSDAAVVLLYATENAEKDRWIEEARRSLEGRPKSEAGNDREKGEEEEEEEG